jgi:hypothetical protein
MKMELRRFRQRASGILPEDPRPPGHCRSALEEHQKIGVNKSG